MMRRCLNRLFKRGDREMATITPEEAFDMALMAFGSGAGGLYVKPKVAKMLRTKLFDNFINEISQNPSQWEKSKIFLLECARCIGRLAAQNAIQRGTMAIDWAHDAEIAVQKVINRYGGPVPGAWCRMNP